MGMAYYMIQASVSFLNITRIPYGQKKGSTLLKLNCAFSSCLKCSIKIKVAKKSFHLLVTFLFVVTKYS